MLRRKKLPRLHRNSEGTIFLPLPDEGLGDDDYEVEVDEDGNIEVGSADDDDEEDADDEEDDDEEDDDEEDDDEEEDDD